MIRSPTRDVLTSPGGMAAFTASRGSDAQWEAPEASDDEAVLAHGRVVGVELERGGAPEDLAEDHLRFEAREGGADTEVHAPPEGEMVPGRRAVEDDFVWSLELSR